MTSYTITVTAAELDVVRLALGRMVEPKKVAAKKPAGPKRYAHRVPKLSPSAHAGLVSRWEAAVAEPERWRIQLADAAGANTNRTGSDVEKAWGIVR